MTQIQQTTITDTERQSGQLQALPLSKSIPLFVIPAIMGFVASEWGILFFESLGYAPLISFLAAMTLPLALLFVAALYGYHKVEGHPLTWQVFRKRMRYPALKWRDALLVLLIIVGGIIGSIVTTPISMFLANSGLIPENLPVLLDPARTPETLHAAAGGSITGQYSILLLYAVYLFFNIAGEELWWRGYILPRQELAHGQWTWLVHGIMWTLFHAFRWWELLNILPIALVMAYVSYRFKSNWAVTIAHFIGNFALATFVIAGVMGAF